MESRRIVAERMNNEGGYVLVGALLILLLLIVIGISATTSTVLEIQIAGSDRTHKETFYAADGGTHVGSELVEQAIFDFPSVTLPLTLNTGVSYLGDLFVSSNYKDIPFKGVVDPTDVSSGVNRDAYFNYGVADPTGTTIPRTDIWIGGHETEFNEGSNIGGLAGGEGEGKGSASGGGEKLYEIHSKSYGNNNSESWLYVEWSHVL